MLPFGAGVMNAGPGEPVVEALGFLSKERDTVGEFAWPVRMRVGKLRRPVLHAGEAGSTGPAKP